MVPVEEEGGGGAGEGGSVEQTPVAAAAEAGGVGGAGEGGSDEKPCAAVRASAEVPVGVSYEGGDDSGGGATDGQPRMVAMAEEREVHVGADGGGSPGERSNGVLDAWKRCCFLLHGVMKWGVKDVMNSDLFRENVSTELKCLLSRILLIIISK
jgi:hypothetical protein